MFKNQGGVQKNLVRSIWYFHRGKAMDEESDGDAPSFCRERRLQPTRDQDNASQPRSIATYQRTHRTRDATSYRQKSSVTPTHPAPVVPYGILDDR